tara:strand:- start:409 stop:750 length:342 start_codon:yes stop_codon:yes gene_type:complete
VDAGDVKHCLGVKGHVQLSAEAEGVARAPMHAGEGSIWWTPIHASRGELLLYSRDEKPDACERCLLTFDEPDREGLHKIVEESTGRGVHAFFFEHEAAWRRAAASVGLGVPVP